MQDSAQNFWFNNIDDDKDKIYSYEDFFEKSLVPYCPNVEAFDDFKRWALDDAEPMSELDIANFELYQRYNLYLDAQARQAEGHLFDWVVFYFSPSLCQFLPFILIYYIKYYFIPAYNFVGKYWVWDRYWTEHVAAYPDSWKFYHHWIVNVDFYTIHHFWIFFPTNYIFKFFYYKIYIHWYYSLQDFFVPIYKMILNLIYVKFIKSYWFIRDFRSDNYFMVYYYEYFVFSYLIKIKFIIIGFIGFFINKLTFNTLENLILQIVEFSIFYFYYLIFFFSKGLSGIVFSNSFYLLLVNTIYDRLTTLDHKLNKIYAFFIQLFWEFDDYYLTNILENYIIYNYYNNSFIVRISDILNIVYIYIKEIINNFFYIKIIINYIHYSNFIMYYNAITYNNIINIFLYVPKIIMFQISSTYYLIDFFLYPNNLFVSFLLIFYPFFFFLKHLLLFIFSFFFYQEVYVDYLNDLFNLYEDIVFVTEPTFLSCILVFYVIFIFFISFYLCKVPLFFFSLNDYNNYYNINNKDELVNKNLLNYNKWQKKKVKLISNNEFNYFFDSKNLSLWSWNDFFNKIYYFESKFEQDPVLVKNFKLFKKFDNFHTSELLYDIKKVKLLKKNQSEHDHTWEVTENERNKFEDWYEDNIFDKKQWEQLKKKKYNDDILENWIFSNNATSMYILVQKLLINNYDSYMNYISNSKVFNLDDNFLFLLHTKRMLLCIFDVYCTYLHSDLLRHLLKTNDEFIYKYYLNEYFSEDTNIYWEEVWYNQNLRHNDLINRNFFFEFPGVIQNHMNYIYSEDFDILEYRKNLFFKYYYFLDYKFFFRKIFNFFNYNIAEKYYLYKKKKMNNLSNNIVWSDAKTLDIHYYFFDNLKKSFSVFFEDYICFYLPNFGPLFYFFRLDVFFPDFFGYTIVDFFFFMFNTFILGLFSDKENKPKNKYLNILWYLFSRISFLLFLYKGLKFIFRKFAFILKFIFKIFFFLISFFFCYYLIFLIYVFLKKLILNLKLIFFSFICFIVIILDSYFPQLLLKKRFNKFIIISYQYKIRFFLKKRVLMWFSVLYYNIIYFLNILIFHMFFLCFWFIWVYFYLLNLLCFYFQVAFFCIIF